MNLLNVVSEIKGKQVTEDEAKQFALDQFGMLMQYIIEKKLSINYKIM